MSAWIICLDGQTNENKEKYSGTEGFLCRFYYPTDRPIKVGFLLFTANKSKKYR